MTMTITDNVGDHRNLFVWKLRAVNFRGTRIMAMRYLSGGVRSRQRIGGNCYTTDSMRTLCIDAAYCYRCIDVWHASKKVKVAHTRLPSVGFRS